MSVYKASPGIRWYANLTKRQIDASYAVIEAAKAWASTIDVRDCVPGDWQTDVILAVRALQEAEGE